jgi:hypothetical protein
MQGGLELCQTFLILFHTLSPLVSLWTLTHTHTIGQGVVKVSTNTELFNLLVVHYVHDALLIPSHVLQKAFGAFIVLIS